MGTCPGSLILHRNGTVAGCTFRRARRRRQVPRAHRFLPASRYDRRAARQRAGGAARPAGRARRQRGREASGSPAGSVGVGSRRAQSEFGHDGRAHVSDRECSTCATSRTRPCRVATRRIGAGCLPVDDLRGAGRVQRGDRDRARSLPRSPRPVVAATRRAARPHRVGRAPDAGPCYAGIALAVTQPARSSIVERVGVDIGTNSDLRHRTAAGQTPRARSRAASGHGLDTRGGPCGRLVREIPPRTTAGQNHGSQSAHRSHAHGSELRNGARGRAWACDRHCSQHARDRTARRTH